MIIFCLKCVGKKIKIRHEKACKEIVINFFAGLCFSNLILYITRAWRAFL